MNSPSRSPAPLYRWPVRVYYEDTDTGGIVYYANYLKFFERCRTEWLRSIGVEQRNLAAHHHVQFVVTAVQLDYRKPALLDDLLEVDMQCERLRRVSFEFSQSLRRAGELLATLKIKVACIDARSFVPTPLPAFIADPLKQLPAAAQPNH